MTKRTPPPTNKVITRSTTNYRNGSATSLSTPVLQGGKNGASYTDNVFESGSDKNYESLFTFLTDQFVLLKNQLDVANSNINMLLEENREIKSEIRQICNVGKETSGKQLINLGRVSYAEQLKSSGPVIHIAPKDQKQNSEQTKEVVKSKIDPVSNQINGIRRAANGAVVVECNNKESSEKLKNDAESI